MQSRIPAFASGFLPPIFAPPFSKRPAWRYSTPRLWRRSRGSAAKVLPAQPRPRFEAVRVVPELRDLVEFRRLNFMDSDYRHEGEGGCHLLPQRDHLLRPATQEQILQKLAHQLAPGGYHLSRPLRDALGIGRAAGVGRTLHSTGKPMAEPESGCRRSICSPGELVLAREPTILATILGSCIGVTFWSARLGIGALCHAMLPRCPRRGREISLAIGISLRRLLHSQPGPAVRRAGRGAGRSPGKGLWRRRCDLRRAGATRGRPWAG